MITERAARRILLTVVACAVLFLISCGYAYVHRGYLAVGGEYAFCLIPTFVITYECMMGGE